MHRPIAATTLALALAAAAAPLSPAAAAILERERYSETISETATFCGRTWDVTGEFSGVFLLKEGRAGDPTPYALDNYSYRVQFIDAATGEGFVQQGNGLFMDLRITNVEGTIYRFEAQEAGQPFSLRTLDGDVVVRDRGLLRSTFLVDTKGDSDHHNDEFIEGSFELLFEAGAHPGFYYDEEALCAAMETVLAS